MQPIWHPAKKLIYRPQHEDYLGHEYFTQMG